MKNLQYKIASLVIVFLLAFSGSSNAQKEEVNSAIQKDNILIEAFYGMPIVNIFGNMPEGNEINSEQGIYGLRIEFLAANWFGFGIEGSYMSGEATQKLGDLNNDNNFFINIDDPTIHNYDSLITYNYQVTRFMPRFDFHLIKSEKVDFNVGVGIGTLNVKSDKVTLSDGSTFSAIQKPNFPMSMRLFIGGKYFVSDNIGIGLSTGIGGGYLIKTAIIAKF